MDMDLIGKKFGKLTVIKKSSVSSWLCRCDCGNEITVCTSKLTSKHTRSCGCLFRKSTQKALETKKRNKKEILKKQVLALVLNPEPTFRNKTSKRKGVCYSKTNNRYLAYINVNGKRIYLGSFVHQEDAIAARKAAEVMYFRNHL